jgi:hypothetical protein
MVGTKVPPYITGYLACSSMIVAKLLVTNRWYLAWCSAQGPAVNPFARKGNSQMCSDLSPSSRIRIMTNIATNITNRLSLAITVEHLESDLHWRCNERLDGS